MTNTAFEKSVCDSPLNKGALTLQKNELGLFVTVALTSFIVQAAYVVIAIISFLRSPDELLQDYINEVGGLLSLVLGFIFLNDMIFYSGLFILLLVYKRLLRFSVANVMLCMCTSIVWIVANWLFSMGMGANFPDFSYVLLQFNDYLTGWFSNYGESMNVFVIPNMVFNGMALSLIFIGLHDLGLRSTTPDSENFSFPIFNRIILIGYSMVFCAVLAGKGSDSLYYLFKWAVDMAFFNGDILFSIRGTTQFLYFLLYLANKVFCYWFVYRLVLYFYEHVTPIRSGQCIQALLLSALSFWVLSYLILAVTTIVLHKIQPNGRMIDHMDSFVCLLVAGGLCFGLCYKLKNKTLRIVIITLLIASVVASVGYYNPEGLDYPGARYSETFIAVYNCVLIPILYLCALVLSVQMGISWINRSHGLNNLLQN